MDYVVAFQLSKKPVAKYKINIYLEDGTQNSSLFFTLKRKQKSKT